MDFQVDHLQDDRLESFCTVWCFSLAKKRNFHFPIRTQSSEKRAETPRTA